jgi:creatinine amidohydrolase
MGARDWAEFKASEFEDIDPMETIAILPVAAIEQHGPHLPVGVDTMINDGMLARLRADCPASIDARILPVQAVGKSNEHLWARGTVTLKATAALAAWTEIGRSIARAGIRKTVIVNSHGGNADLISILARELRVEVGMLAVTSSWSSFPLPTGMYSDTELRFGIHGGDRETSLMLAFRPDTVDMSKAQDFKSSAETTPIGPIGDVKYGWIASDLNPAGAVGEAHLATAEKGEATARHQVAGFIDLLRRVQRMPLPQN